MAAMHYGVPRAASPTGRRVFHRRDESVNVLPDPRQPEKFPGAATANPCNVTGMSQNRQLTDAFRS